MIDIYGRFEAEIAYFRAIPDKGARVVVIHRETGNKDCPAFAPPELVGRRGWCLGLPERYYDAPPVRVLLDGDTEPTEMHALALRQLDVLDALAELAHDPTP